MSPESTGRLIAAERGRKKITREKLAEDIGVSTKTLAKWESGACMPGYSSALKLCGALCLTPLDLLSGETKTHITGMTEEQILDALKRACRLEQEKRVFAGTLLTLCGLCLMLFAAPSGGVSFLNMLSGLVSGLSSGTTAIGLFILFRALIAK